MLLELMEHHSKHGQTLCSIVAGGCGQAETPEEHRGKLFVLEAGECARADEPEELGEVLP
jgi:hypothetical protein